MVGGGVVGGGVVEKQQYILGSSLGLREGNLKKVGKNIQSSARSNHIVRASFSQGPMAAFQVWRLLTRIEGISSFT